MPSQKKHTSSPPSTENEARKKKKVLAVTIAMIVAISLIVTLIVVFSLKHREGGDSSSSGAIDSAMNETTPIDPGKYGSEGIEEMILPQHNKLSQPPFNPGGPRSEWPSQLFYDTVKSHVREYIFLTHSTEGVMLFYHNPGEWSGRLSRVASHERVDHYTRAFSTWARDMRAQKMSDEDVKERLRSYYPPIVKQRVRTCGYYDCVFDVLYRPKESSSHDTHDVWTSYGIKQFNKDPRDWRVVTETTTQWLKPQYRH